MECQTLEHATIILANVLTDQVHSLDDTADIGPSCAGFISHAGTLPELNFKQMRRLGSMIHRIIFDLEDVRQMLMTSDHDSLERWQESCKIK